MNFFKKLFNNDQVNLQDVFNSLNAFDNDIKTLRTFSETAYQYFGNNWKFNLEMYISSLPQQEKEIYLTKFKNVMEYEKALSIWTSALQIVKGVKPVSAELLKSMPEYQTYLSKFGIEGERLFEKLNSMFDVAKKDSITPVQDTPSFDSEEMNTIPNNEVAVETEPVSTSDTEVVVEEAVETEPEPSPEPVSEIVLEQTSAPQSEETEEEDEDVDEEVDANVSLTEENQKYRTQLKERILQKVRDIEQRKQVLKEELSVEKSVETKKTKKQRQSIEEVNTDWILNNFKKISEFLSNSREIMSAISIYKNAQSVEEYKNYGFILDILDYLIEKGEEILSEKTDEEIEKVFSGGRVELSNLISSYKNERNSEVIIPEEPKVKVKKGRKKTS